MLTAHNSLRVLHGVDPLNLNPEVKFVHVNLSLIIFDQICSDAQSLAEAMVTEDRFQLSDPTYGANIMISSIRMVSINTRGSTLILTPGVWRGSRIPVVQ